MSSSVKVVADLYGSRQACTVGSSFLRKLPRRGFIRRLEALSAFLSTLVVVLVFMWALQKASTSEESNTGI